MRRQILGCLSSVRLRQQLQQVFRHAALGLMASGGALFLVAVLRLAAGTTLPLSVGLLIMATGPLVGVLIACLNPGSWHEAAVAVDRHYRLNDLAASALEFSSRTKPAPVHELQLERAADRLAQVSGREVVPLTLPDSFSYAVGLTTVALALIAIPLAAPSADASPTPPNAMIVAEAKSLEEDFVELEKMFGPQPTEEMKELLADLRTLAEAMKQPGVDAKEALAKLSEMQSAVATVQAQYNVALVDAHLQSLGSALTLAPSMEAAGMAMEAGKFDRAAEELAKLNEPPADRKTAKTMAEKLAQLAHDMEQAGLSAMSQNVRNLATGISEGSKTKFNAAKASVCKDCQNQSKRKEIANCLACQMRRLSECKGQCQSNCTGKCPVAAKSTKPSSTAGTGALGNIDGDPTNQRAMRDRKEITGKAGDGESEIETTHSPEGREVAQRAYRSVYQKYQKLSEAVLESEPIPLGHRQTIRRYFELIRPAGNEGEK